jgi:Icc protein
MDDAPLQVVQISDIHLFGDKNKSLLGVNTQDSFAAVIELLKSKHSKPDLILLSGDLSQDGSVESYTRLAAMLKDFPLPIYYVPGNHDDSQVMTQIYPLDNITHHRHIVLKHWHIILLDSHKPNKVEGYLDQAQLSFLQHCLQMYPEHHAIVLFHHQPVPVGSAWLDNLGLTNANELWSILVNFPKLHTILFGHVHQQHEGRKNDIQYLSAPSTCVQFKRNSAEFALEELAPGYRWIELHSDGNLMTGIERAAHYVGKFDVDAKGY